MRLTREQARALGIKLPRARRRTAMAAVLRAWAQIEGHVVADGVEERAGTPAMIEM